jgi:hypothetical protein
MYARVLNAFGSVYAINSITEMKTWGEGSKIFLHIERTRRLIRIVTFANAVIGFIFWVGL